MMIPTFRKMLMKSALNKQSKMKIHTLKKRWFLPALSYTAIAMTSQSNGAVIVSFEQLGANVVATWSGSIDAGSFLADSVWVARSYAGSLGLYSKGTDTNVYSGGTNMVTSLSGTVDSFAGGEYGFFNPTFRIGSSEVGAPASSIVDFDTITFTQTFSDDTLLNIGATNFNNTLAWTSSKGGTNTISFTTVPEPSSTALIGFGAFTLAIRRRR